MTYYIDLTNVSPNNYRVLRPNAFLGVGLLNGTLDYNLTPGVGVLANDWDNTNLNRLFEDSVDPTANTPLSGFGGGSSQNPPNAVANQRTSQPNLDAPTGFNTLGYGPIVYNGNGQNLASMLLGFPSLSEIPDAGIVSTAPAGSALPSTHIVRLLVDPVNSTFGDQLGGATGGGSATVATLEVSLRYGATATTIGTPIATLPLPNGNPLDIVRNTTPLGSGRLGTEFTYEFTVPSALDYSNLGSRRFQNVNIFINQIAGNAGGNNRRSFPRIWGVELYVNTLLINPYEPQNRGYLI